MALIALKWVAKATLLISFITWLASGPAGAESRDGGTLQQRVSPAMEMSGTEIFRIGYMRSETGGAIRSATVVSVTNDSSQACPIYIDWRKGFASRTSSPVMCGLYFATLQPGDTADLCSRVLPGSVTACNAACQPPLTFVEGSAIVGSTDDPACAALTVSARTYYFGATDTAIIGITEPAVTRIGSGSRGD